MLNVIADFIYFSFLLVHIFGLAESPKTQKGLDHHG